jgi:hypothetical protein
MAGQAREIVLYGEIAVSDDRGVTHIDDRQDAIAGLATRAASLISSALSR